jgi:hypothetical protein
MLECDDPRVSLSMEMDSMSDALATMPRNLLIRVGGYDEDYYNSNDDVDLCLKIKQAGFTIFYNPKIIGYHVTSASKEYRFAKDSEGRKLLFERWKQNIVPHHQALFNCSIKTFNVRNNILPKEAIIIDICKKATTDIVNVFLELSHIKPVYQYNYREYLSDVPLFVYQIDIDLLDILPITDLLIRIPIIYIVDSFTFLKQNYYWAKKRVNQSDIVFDRSFNLYTLNEVVFGL